MHRRLEDQRPGQRRLVALYTFRTDDTTHHYLNDYPKFGLWSDGV